MNGVDLMAHEHVKDKPLPEAMAETVTYPGARMLSPEQASRAALGILFGAEARRARLAEEEAKGAFVWEAWDRPTITA